MLLSQTNIDMMYHHNMLSITAFTLLKSLSENQRFMPKNWLSAYVCQPWPVICIQTESPRTLDTAKQVITGPKTYFSNDHNLFVVISVHIFTKSLQCGSKRQGPHVRVVPLVESDCRGFIAQSQVNWVPQWEVGVYVLSLESGGALWLRHTSSKRWRCAPWLPELDC